MIDAGQLQHRAPQRAHGHPAGERRPLRLGPPPRSSRPGSRRSGRWPASFRTIGDRKFQVAGDTDNVPIHNERFASNWELSTARAVEVVRFLIAQGVRPELLSAAGYGEFDPVAPNEDAGGRAKNRRIEITLQPNIDELVYVPPG